MRQSVGKRSQRGFTLLEAVFACAILMIAALGLMGMFAVGTAANANQGDQATRTTEYAQDKMEQLMALEFVDSGSDVTQNTTCYYYDTSCSRPCGYGLTATSSITADCAVDYIDGNGNVVNVSGEAHYIRQWSITDASATLKTIQVTVTGTKKIGSVAPPKTVLVSQRVQDYTN